MPLLLFLRPPRASGCQPEGSPVFQGRIGRAPGVGTHVNAWSAGTGIPGSPVRRWWWGSVRNALFIPQRERCLPHVARPVGANNAPPWRQFPIVGHDPADVPGATACDCSNSGVRGDEAARDVLNSRDNGLGEGRQQGRRLCRLGLCLCLLMRCGAHL